MPEDAFTRFRRLRGRLAPAGEAPRAPAMTPEALVHSLHGRGVRLRPMVTHVDVEDQAGVLTDDEAQAIRRHQTALLDVLEAFEERAAIAEFCGGLARDEAERLAWVWVLGEVAP